MLFVSPYYTIPRKIRELQYFHFTIHRFVIIPYQEKLGNYNLVNALTITFMIIPYQEKLGNYNQFVLTNGTTYIIPYQEKLGNYNPLGKR